MANIPIERRKEAGKAYLIWIVVVVLLMAAALVYVFAVRDRTPRTTAPPAGIAGAVHLPAPPQDAA
jgi:hypothetical protein